MSTLRTWASVIKSTAFSSCGKCLFANYEVQSTLSKRLPSCTRACMWKELRREIAWILTMLKKTSHLDISSCLIGNSRRFGQLLFRQYWFTLPCTYLSSYLSSLREHRCHFGTFVITWSTSSLSVTYTSTLCRLMRNVMEHLRLVQRLLPRSIWNHGSLWTLSLAYQSTYLSLYFWVLVQMIKCNKYGAFLNCPDYTD